MILEANNISKSYRNGSNKLSVFTNINMEIEFGDLITIMGASGAGKSTLLNILGTLDNPDTGTLIINGKSIDSLSQIELSHLRNRVLGFVFQFHHLLPEFTALENVLIPNQIAGNDGDKKKAVELLDYIGLSDRIYHYPSQLSGGERLRVAVIRSLMNEPKLVLADEPTGNLDLGNANRLMDLFKKINSDFNQAFVITTHNPEVAAIGKKKYYIENGILSLTDRF
ncbi:MAG: ABC transporter ATP-binding protein [Candidatus Marinimicrobia bacterium]|jgi:lipoprotein-releasing system ATP-binding protein|nr:ABC transporter ATP-binding protein [Candidatus Neomarinimicrobiota bacterium]MDP7566176.1 ABC transporter ATP-binding protein [Candidatus Neomarinimicrobiota bacterium]|tara:strand:+ start:906 stop:1580 length:675 start_codon:yes stop_codon:yes gene_type:complete